MIKKYKGDLLLAGVDFIVHQVNCVSTSECGGFAYNLFSKYNDANVYELTKPSERRLGDIYVNKVFDELNKKHSFIVNIFRNITQVVMLKIQILINKVIGKNIS